MYQVSPLLYGQNGISVNEPLAPRWQVWNGDSNKLKNYVDEYVVSDQYGCADACEWVNEDTW